MLETLKTVYRWRPRYSLRRFLLFCVVCGSIVATSGYTYHTYLSERQFVTKFVGRSLSQAPL